MAPANMQIKVSSASLQKPKTGIASGMPSPYVVVEVVGREEVRFQTPVVRHSIAPLWDFTFEVDCFEAGDTLQFTLMDNNSWPRSDKSLGKACLARTDIPIHSGNCKLELPFAENGTSATLFLAVVIANDEEACEHEDCCPPGVATNEPLHPRYGDAVDQGDVLEQELTSKSVVVVVDGGGGEGDENVAGSHLLLEGTDSADLSTSTAASAEPLVMVPLQRIGKAVQAEPVQASCVIQSPILCMRKVHAPVTVSAEEFARALTGGMAVNPVETSKVASGKSVAEKPQSLDKAPKKPTKQVKIKRKAKFCC